MSQSLKTEPFLLIRIEMPVNPAVQSKRMYIRPMFSQKRLTQIGFVVGSSSFFIENWLQGVKGKGEKRFDPRSF